MKVLHVAETIKGGIATILDQLLDADNYESIALIPHDHLHELSNKNKVFTYKRSGRNILSFINLIFCFCKIIFKSKPDVIHIHSSFAGVICRLLLIFNKKIRIIYCPHGFSFMMDVSHARKMIYAFVEIFLSKFTYKIICTSEFEKRLAIKYGLPESKLCVIYNGIRPPLKSVSKTKSPFDGDKLNLLFVGRFDKQKAFDFVLMVSEHLNAHVHITVIGDYVNDKHKSLPETIDHVGWLDKKELAKYYYHSDIVFMPSRWESFGLVAVESHSYRTPVLVSNNASLPEIVCNNVTGYVFNEYNAIEVAQKINSLNKNDLQLMSENCYLNYRSKFSQEIMLNQVFSCYKEKGL